jgi:hypothetical protein
MDAGHWSNGFVLAHLARRDHRPAPISRMLARVIGGNEAASGAARPAAGHSVKPEVTYACKTSAPEAPHECRR